MLYTFNDFHFESEMLVLSRGGEDLKIRHNEARLLRLFLENKDKVLSKEEILESLWKEKVVTDQAVFQNISHLRTLFGNDAIKTFSKRGYQWQIPFQLLANENKLANDDLVPPHKSIQSAQTKKLRSGYFAWLAPVLFGVTLLLAWVATQDKGTSVQEIGYLPFTSSSEIGSIALKNNTVLDFVNIDSLSAKTFITSHQLEYQKLSQTHSYILTGEVRRYNDLLHLNFLLKGPYADWTGQISATTKDGLVERLKTHLEQPLVFDYISRLQSPEIRQASLSIAHENNPNDLVVLEALVKSYYETFELDKAMVMSEKLIELAKLQENVQYIGNAQLNQSAILTRKELFKLSGEKLSLAKAQFEKINDLQRLADTMEKQSWLDHQAGDYEAIKASLLKSAEYALAAEDIPRELHALTYLSVMAKKYREDHDKYFYLQQAEKKMNEYQLPIYHYAKIPFHYAIFTKEASAKEPHWKRVLEYTQLNPDYWVAQSTRKQLLEFYISQNRIQEAEELVGSVKSENAPNEFLKVLLAKARKDKRKFLKHAQKTFELAQLAGFRELSLDVALMLCEEPDSAVNFDFYSQYIKENSTKYWRIDNQKKLLALNL